MLPLRSDLKEGGDFSHFSMFSHSMLLFFSVKKSLKNWKSFFLRNYFIFYFFYIYYFEFWFFLDYLFHMKYETCKT